MTAMDEITERLEGFKKSGLIADFEMLVVDDSIRVRITAPRNEDAADVKTFVADALSGRLSPSQISVDVAPE